MAGINIQKIQVKGGYVVNIVIMYEKLKQSQQTKMR